MEHTLFVGASWGLQAANIASDLPRCRTGFPSNADVHKLYTEEGRTWLQNPDDASALVDAIASAYSQRFGKVETRSALTIGALVADEMRSKPASKTKACVKERSVVEDVVSKIISTT